MKSIKSLALATITISLLGVFASVCAQTSDERPIPVIDPLKGTFNMKVNADELALGDSKFETQETYGWTCYGTTDGDLTGFMFISMNYSFPKESKSNRPQPIPLTSQIIGGSWSKLIFKDGQYLGSVNGRIIGGELVWNETDLNASMHLDLSADNGTGLFVGSIGKGKFQGTLDRMSKVSTVSGELILEY